MSDRQTYVVAVLLTVIGMVLLGVVFVFIFAFWWCLGTESPLVAKVCSQGNFRDVAMSLAGAVSALWGAHQLRKG